MKFNQLYKRIVEEETDIHPFEKSGLGKAPFRYVGMFSMPSQELAEQNPEAYTTAMREIPREYNAGICSYCGRPISNICMIHSADGRKFGVGTECVLKTEGEDKVRDDLKKIQNEKRARFNREQREKWEREHPEIVKQREEEIQRKIADEEERKKNMAIEQEKIKAKWKFVVDVLDNSGNSFIQTLVDQLKNGIPPLGRGVNIVADNYARSFGRRNSKGYDAAYDEFFDKIEGNIVEEEDIFKASTPEEGVKRKQEYTKILIQYIIDNAIKNPDGSYDVNDDVKLYDMELTELPQLKLNRVNGNFECYNNKLTSLKGAPREVEGVFDCSDNQLTSLEGSPKFVGKDFVCDLNENKKFTKEDIRAICDVKGDIYV